MLLSMPLELLNIRCSLQRSLQALARTSIPVVCAAGLLAVSLSSGAVVSTFASANNSVGLGGGASQTGTTYASATSNYSDPSWESHGAASAAIGELRGFASVTAQTAGFVGATIFASFQDSFVAIASPSVPFIDLIWVLKLEGSCLATPGATNGRPNAGCYVQMGMETPQLGLVLHAAGEVTTTQRVSRNATVYIQPILQVGVTGTNGTAVGNFSGTGHLYVYSANPSVTLISESGHNYSLPVPEPTVIALWLTGLIGMAVMLNLRRRRLVRGVTFVSHRYSDGGSTNSMGAMPNTSLNRTFCSGRYSG